MSSNTINLSEGLEEFNLVFTDRGEAVTIAFNPSDTDIIMRIEKSRENIEAALAGAIKRGQRRSCVNHTCGRYNPAGDRLYFCKQDQCKVFKFCSPLTVNADGVTFVERFLAAVTPHIQSRINDANRASAERIAKHTAKYVKK